jgi:1-acyl-sn-glycerol-3-phosphate acyltransferase
MSTAREVPPISAAMLRFFRGVVRSYFQRHFRSVAITKLSHKSLPDAGGPCVIYANHSSWWDPMVMVFLGERFPVARNYAPMDATALEKYPILRKLGIFPIDMATARGAAQFLRTSQAILDEGGALWITPQGRFADPREPLVFKPGLGALAARNPAVAFHPLAIEYTFWDERLPEALLHFGPAVLIEGGTSTEEATLQLEAGLASAMQELRAKAIARDPAAFQPMLTGGRGTGGFYALGRRLRGLFTGRRAALDHTERTTTNPEDGTGG